MTASELESRIIAAEQDSSLVRQLITDFRAHKDAQCSDLTNQVNDSDKRAEEKHAATIKSLTEERDELAASLSGRIAAQDDLALRAKAAYEAAAAAFATFGAILGEALTPAEQKAAAEREAKRAKLQAELDALK